MHSHGRFVPSLTPVFLGLSVLAMSGVPAVADDDAPSSTTRELPPGELGKVVALGKEIVEKTGEHTISKPFVRNALTCSSCHLDAGTPPLEIDVKLADSGRGATLYGDYCASCHGDRGVGTDDGPPVWGDMSYNDGAGLSRVDKLAAWLKVAMPLDDPFLTEQEALDIAAFVNSHPRPKFVLKEHLPNAARLGEYNAESE